MSTPYIVVDLDGTLADNRHRAHLAEAKKWDEFHALMGEDAVFEDVLNTIWCIFGDIDNDYATFDYAVSVVFLTARDEKYRELTEAWLGKVGVPAHTLVMRDRPHHEESAGDFKLRALKGLEEAYGCKPLFCLEDQMNITLQLRAAGYNVWNVRNSHA